MTATSLDIVFDSISRTIVIEKLSKCKFSNDRAPEAFSSGDLKERNHIYRKSGAAKKDNRGQST